jgi:hypothetical protein
MKRLPETAPVVYDHFMAGGFVVKRSSIPFSAVAADMCLEQTINRSSKTSGGIIGNTKRKEFVARWNIIHHELMAVNQTHWCAIKQHITYCKSFIRSSANTTK